MPELVIPVSVQAGEIMRNAILSEAITIARDQLGPVVGIAGEITAHNKTDDGTDYEVTVTYTERLRHIAETEDPVETALELLADPDYKAALDKHEDG